MHVRPPSTTYFILCRFTTPTLLFFFKNTKGHSTFKTGANHRISTTQTVPTVRVRQHLCVFLSAFATFLALTPRIYEPTSKHLYC